MAEVPKCTEDFSKKGFFPIALLYEALDDHYKENGIPPLTGTFRKRAANIIIDWLTGAFGIPVYKYRTKAVRGIQGFRLAEENERLLALPEPPAEPDIDPFEIAPLFSYEKLRTSYQPQAARKAVAVPLDERELNSLEILESMSSNQAQEDQATLETNKIPESEPQMTTVSRVTPILSGLISQEGEEGPSIKDKEEKKEEKDRLENSSTPSGDEGSPLEPEQ
jgi:hypothetical protein